MAQIEYCDDEIQEWHPIFESGPCADVCENEWGLDDIARLVWTVSQIQSEVVDSLDAGECSLEAEFYKHATRWKRETALYGNLSKIVLHPDYQRIMAMGPKVISFIIKDLAEKPAHWFWALHNLVPAGQDPAEGLTTVEGARQAWLKWGRDNDYL
ncbi:MAG: hypothetical protein WAK27_22215 [Candidatus Sulfotelmatobacter sp.]